MPSFYEEVDGVKIHYEKVGSGPIKLLLIPGAIGCTRSDFSQQIDGGLDQNEFTIIAIDLPGWGKSCPPKRMFSSGAHENDAKKAAGLMEKLGYKLYSVFGWSHGSKIALLLAINNQARVEKLVIWGVMPQVNKYDLTALSRTRDTSVFDPKSRELYVKAYGEEMFDQLWHKHVDYCLGFLGNPSAYWDMRDAMKTIRCPTLILHGDKDPLIDKNHPYTAERIIADSRLYRFANGSHNIHQMYEKEFNRVVTEFLLE